ncbi:MAG: PQQ-dependent sugar dehydrogenase [Bdellovibrionota bacterium]
MLRNLVLSLFLLSGTAFAQESPVSSHANTHVYKPAHIAATDDLIRKLKVPHGFSVVRIASGLGRPRMLAVGNGRIYVTRREDDVKFLRDENGDGLIDRVSTAATLKNVHGIYLHDRHVYLAAISDVFRGDIAADGSFVNLVPIARDLPDAGQHPNRTLAFGPDKKLYLSVGSTCNACDEKNDENATMLQMAADGSGRRVFAKGLRNTIGFDWSPETHLLWGFDNGIDGLGDTEQKEELNLIEEGNDYGWPFVYADRKLNAERQPEGIKPEEYAKRTTPPALLYDAHCAPISFLFYRGGLFPNEYRTDAFVAMHGSWNRADATGYKVVRVRFDNGRPVATEDFLTGFLVDNGTKEFGRVTGLAVDSDGSLLVSDDADGNIYRVRYSPPA